MTECDPLSSEAMYEKHIEVVRAYQASLKKKQRKLKKSSAAASTDGVVSYDWVKKTAADPESSELAAP